MAGNLFCQKRQTGERQGAEKTAAALSNTALADRLKPLSPFVSRAPVQWLLALLLGLLGSAGFAPWEFPAALAASTAGLFWLAANESRVLVAALTGFFWGLAYFASGLSWTYNSMHVYGGLPAVLSTLGVLALGALLALVPGALCAIAARIPAARAVKLVLILPALWCLGELVRGSWVMGFGWLSSGYAWAESLFNVWAPVAGVYGVGLVVNVLIGAVLVLLSPYDRSRVVLRAMTAVFAGAIALVTVALDLVVWSKPAQTLEVRLVQPDLPVALTAAHEGERLARVKAMSDRSAMAGYIDLTVWPEGLFSMPVERLAPQALAAALETAERTQGAVLFNGFSQKVDPEKPGRIAVYNSLWLAGSTEGSAPVNARVPETAAKDQAGVIAEVYQKHHLVPFGEFVPWGFRWFVDALGIPMADQTRGPVGGARPVEIGGAQAALTICYENMFGEELRAWWSHGNPQVIFNVANLGWFAPRVADQFTQMSVMRALETARPLVQAVNNAGSSLITPTGKIERSAAAGAQNLDLTVRLYTGTPTWFVRFGNVLAAGAALVLLIVAAACMRLRRREGGAAR